MSMLTKLSSDVVLSVKPILPGQSMKSIVNGKKPPVSISESCMVLVAEYSHPLSVTATEAPDITTSTDESGSTDSKVSVTISPNTAIDE